jgi:membrane-associated phospholipid phosphatase
MKKSFKWIIVGISLILFSMLIYFIKTNNVDFIDNYFYNLVVLGMRQDWLTPIMKVLSFVGDKYFYFIVIILFFIFDKKKKTPILMTLNVGGGALVMKVIKHFIARPRPDGFRLVAETGFSFPSGHAMNCVIFYGFIIYLIWKHVKDVKKRNIYTGLLVLLMLLIGLSRIYLGVHYATDVIGGYLFGLIYVILFFEIVVKYFSKKRVKNE